MRQIKLLDYCNKKQGYIVSVTEGNKCKILCIDKFGVSELISFTIDRKDDKYD